MMEGYTNVIGSPYDFDDLDIEGSGRADDWNADDRKVTHNFKPLQHIDENAILSTHVRLDNGQQADVFSVVNKRDNKWYTCHVCTDTVVGLAALKNHVDSTGHRTNMKIPAHPRAKFIKLDPKENVALEPGEPVPPGLEETIIKHCIIQPTLDAYTSLPLIGLEFLVEMTQCTLDFELMYFCLLCDKTGSERNMLIHLTSVFHYMKYLSIYFPTLARKLHSLPNKKLKKCFGLLVQEICVDIEAKYGRLKPRWVTYSDFYSPGRKQELTNQATEGPHIREIDGELFDEKATAENIERKSRELLSRPPATPEVDVMKKALALTFNKTKEEKRIDRMYITPGWVTPREDDKCSSPDIQFVGVQLPDPPASGKRGRSRSKSLSSISTVSSTTGQERSRPHYQNRSQQQGQVSGYNRSQSRSRNHSRSRSRDRDRGRGSRDQQHPGRRSPYRRQSPAPRYRDRSPYTDRSRMSGRNRSPDTHRSKVTDRFGRTRDQYDRSDKHDRNDRSDRSDRYERNDKKYDRNDRYRRDDSERSQSNSIKLKCEKYEEDIKKLDKSQWDKFREEMRELETEKIEKLKFHEKNPEKHPQYPEEWKGFWNKRYNELQRSGIDPAKHDFKPEWISFWTKRMKELHDEDLRLAKEGLKKKYELPDDPLADRDRNVPWKYNQRKRNNSSPGLVDISPPTPDKRDMINSIKSTWKALTGSDIKEAPKRPLSPWEDEPRTRDSSPPGKKRIQSKSPSPDINDINDKLLEEMPQRKSRTSSLIFVLRKLTVLEEQLGSLAPKVFELLTHSLALEKVKENASLDLLHESDNAMFLETVREKLIALLCAGVVPRNIVNTARAAIKHTDIALYIASKRDRILPIDQARSLIGIQHMFPLNNTIAVQPPVEPVAVPGVGAVDKASIAQQIALALVAQGKTNVTEAELAQLVNAVVGMAEASANSSQPITTANFLSQLQSMQNASFNVPMAATSTHNFNVAPTDVMHNPMMHSQPSFSSTPEPPKLSHPPQPSFTPQQRPTLAPQSVPPSSSLKLLQSAYDDVPKSDSPKPDVVVASETRVLTTISDKDLAATLASFNKLSKIGQPHFIQKLQSMNPDMYKRLQPFIPESFGIESDEPKRTPINISLSKEKSEQKIKTSFGRLSPFSSRASGSNPTGEQQNNSIPVLSDDASIKQATKLGKIDDSDQDNDYDDDDDYTYEDVYKAAQEKLRKKQVEEDVKSNKSLEIVNPELDENTQATQSTGLDRPVSNVSSQMQWSQEDNSTGNLLGNNKNLNQSDTNQQLSNLNQTAPATLKDHLHSNPQGEDSTTLANPVGQVPYNNPHMGSIQETYLNAQGEPWHPERGESLDSRNLCVPNSINKGPHQESFNNPRDPMLEPYNRGHILNRGILQETFNDPRGPIQDPYSRGPIQDSFNKGTLQETLNDAKGPIHDPYSRGSDQDPYSRGPIQESYSRGSANDPYNRGPFQDPYNRAPIDDAFNRGSNTTYSHRAPINEPYSNQHRPTQEYYKGPADEQYSTSREAVRDPYSARGPIQEPFSSSHRGYGSSSLSGPYNLPPRSQMNPRSGAPADSYDMRQREFDAHFDRQQEPQRSLRGEYPPMPPPSSRYPDNNLYRY